jgi:hypothetical protein
MIWAILFAAWILFVMFIWSLCVAADKPMPSPEMDEESYRE